MNKIRAFGQRLHARLVARTADETGQGLAEYALILALVAVLCVVALGSLQVGIAGALNSAAAAF